MASYLTRLAQRTQGLAPRMRPLIAPRFAPGPEVAAFEEVSEVRSPDERGPVEAERAAWHGRAQPEAAEAGPRAAHDRVAEAQAVRAWRGLVAPPVPAIPVAGSAPHDAPNAVSGQQQAAEAVRLEGTLPALEGAPRVRPGPALPAGNGPVDAPPDVRREAPRSPHRLAEDELGPREHGSQRGELSGTHRLVPTARGSAPVPVSPPVHEAQGALPRVDDVPEPSEDGPRRDERPDARRLMPTARERAPAPVETTPRAHALETRPAEPAPLRISIGRIDVHAPQPAAPRRAPARPPPVLALRDYLKQVRERS